MHAQKSAWNPSHTKKGPVASKTLNLWKKNLKPIRLLSDFYE